MQALSGSQDALFCQLFLQCPQSWNPVKEVDGSAKTLLNVKFCRETLHLLLLCSCMHIQPEKVLFP